MTFWESFFWAVGVTVMIGGGAIMFVVCLIRLIDEFWKDKER